MSVQLRIRNMGTSTSLALRESRVLFRAFYAGASADDAAAMDVLVKAYVSVMLGILLPRRNVSDSIRMRIERDCDQAEREFLKARDQVRGCRTFLSLSSGDQKRVATLFELHMPTE
jgi:hypothetical protein